ncbi:MAG TPA: hypothetical protein VGY97_00195 [Solirubrobacteraceae bacterium]|jgi:hypothetical protein|nr:hypothetical protein [Solirubrobacteraceae bacterium]
MPPEPRLVPRFIAEPPQEPLPYGRWAERLGSEFLAACLRLEGGGQDLGEPGEIAWYPDRGWHGRTYVPATAPTSTGLELFGFVWFVGDTEEEPSEFGSHADFTSETAVRHPEWQIDLCDEVIGSWRGERGRRAAVTLVWGSSLVAGGAIATAELADITVDQCPLVENRFTLIAPDDYGSDYLEVRLFNGRGDELARESLYEESDDEESDDEPSRDEGTGDEPAQG